MIFCEKTHDTTTSNNHLPLASQNQFVAPIETKMSKVNDEDDTLAKIGDARDATFNVKGPVELEVEVVRNQPDEEKIQYLLSRALIREKEEQRDDDVDRDHGIRLFSRQKKYGLARIWFTLIVLTLVYSIQLVALYNLNRDAASLQADQFASWLERGLFLSTDANVNVSDTFYLINQVRATFGGTAIQIVNLPNYPFCLTYKGFIYVLFNVGVGLVMIYLFLFFDLWFVVFDMPLTRNWASERHGFSMLFGVIWLVLINSAVITWLGVVSGYSVIANAGDFYQVLFTSLQLFIVLVIDDTVLPAVRFFIEEAGRLDAFGNLKNEELNFLTHGSQYYKPGYGHNFVRNFNDKAHTATRILAFIAFIVMSTIIFAPAIVTIVNVSNSFKRC